MSFKKYADKKKKEYKKNLYKNNINDKQFYKEIKDIDNVNKIISYK